MSSQSFCGGGGKKEEKGRNIQVVVRCRPFNITERKSASCGVVDCDQNKKEVAVRSGGVTDKLARKTYTFDMVFGPSAKQIEVYRSVVCPILDEVIMGYNCTVFAYGQTGTGKTFTMEGERSPNEEYTWEEDPLAGIIPRTLHQIFEKLSGSGTEFSIKVSLLEIYNEELFDLLSPSPDVTERLQLYDDPRNKRGVIIKGLEEITVHNKNEVYQILERGAAKRKTASTLMNAYSSRSHSVFSVTIHMKEVTLDGEELVKMGKLNLVDLAGSENIGRSGAVDKRAREAGNINQSLLTLGRVITALVERRPHVPYRESKLTRILQDSLGGRTKTSIIATVSPASINLEETLSTLDYASRAKSIMNKPEVNQKLTKRTLIKEYTEEIERLKRDLAAARDKNGVYLTSERYEDMNNKLIYHEEQILEYTGRIAAMEEELKSVMELFSENMQQLNQCSENLETKSQQLEEAYKDLHETKDKLSQEEFITSALENTEGVLYSTAGKLLSTAEVSTQDLSGLHDKLDRKGQVETHNSKVQQSFAESMDTICSSMQRSLLEQSTKHQNLMEYYTSSVSQILTVNSRVFKEGVSSVASSMSDVKLLVQECVGQCVERVQKQENLSVQAKETTLQTLEELRTQLDDVLLGQALPSTASIMEMIEHLRQSLVTQSHLLEETKGMKEAMTLFFSSHAQALSGLQQTAMVGFATLEAEHEKLKQQLIQTNQMHQTSISQTVQCFLGQMNLLSSEAQSNFEELLKTADGLQTPLNTLRDGLLNNGSKAEEAAASAQVHFHSAVDGLATKMSRVNDEFGKTLEESDGYCQHLQTSLKTLGDDAAQWCQRTRGSAETTAQSQHSFARANADALHGLRQDVDVKGDAVISECRSSLQQLQGELEFTLQGLQKQMCEDLDTLQNYGQDLTSQASQSLSRVHSFLQEELRQDVPTGSTPQRREYSYPRVLMRACPRDELIEQFRAQQERLQSTREVLEEQEEVVDSQSSTDEQTSDSNISETTEPTYGDENLICHEFGGVPFFKKSKKDHKSIPTKTGKTDASTPPRSRLPLMTHN
ncbi:kinesin-like protein KIF11 isoform X2 [Denticeps clupeoides]|uniref:kinesin-like protein KIF11 isoform X2 n=1 Tax=Denticeps clupeoides TaxID=299321 RepID=UPI0010A32991|nr:kinesin-like protein KIF11 isoform X2 [Denticeps clupeoides]